MARILEQPCHQGHFQGVSGGGGVKPKMVLNVDLKFSCTDFHEIYTECVPKILALQHIFLLKIGYFLYK